MGVRALTRAHGAGFSDPGRVIAAATAVFSIGAGVIHVSAAADHRDLPVMMVGFLVVAALQVFLGGLLIWRRPSWPLALAAVGLMLGSVGMWLLSRTVGLPFLPGGHMEPIGFKDGVTVLFELAAVPGLLLLMSRELTGLALPSPRLGTQALALVGAGSFFLFVPALVLGGGEHHSHEQAAAMGIPGHAHGDAEGDGAQLASAGTHPHAGGAGDDHHGSPAPGGARAGGDGHAEADGHDHGASQASSPGGGGSDTGEQLAAALGGDDGHAHGGGAGGGDHGDSPAAPRSNARGHGGGGHAGEGHSRQGDAEQHAGQRHGGAERHGREQAGGDHGGSGDGHGGQQGGGDHGSPGAGDGHGGQQGGSGDDHSEGGSEEPEAQPAGVTYEPAEPGKDGKPGRGGEIAISAGGKKEKPAHGAHGGACNPTPEQQAAAAELHRRTAEALKKYENNPARIAADGYDIVFQGTNQPSRYWHVFSSQHTYDSPSGKPMPNAVQKDRQPVVMDPERIESFMLAMTDKGLVPIGGMYMMPATFDEAKGDLLLPREPRTGPEVGGCLTKWHDHPDLGKATNRSGAPTPMMLHVWTYPGLEPYGEYDGRDLAYLFTPLSQVPTIKAPLGVGPLAELVAGIAPGKPPGS